MLPRDRFLLLALISFNLVVKLLWLGVNELAHDEPFTVYWSQQPLSAFWEMLRTENNPPLYFLLIKAWSAVVPFEVTWLRVPSAVFSALAVWPLFLLAKQLSGVRIAIVATLLFTFNNYHYGFAHEVRAYSLFTLLAITGMWLLWRAKNKPNSGMRALLGLSALNVVMVYTHFFGWLAIGVQCLCVLTLPELRHLRRNFLLGVVITLAWFSPYLMVFLGRMSSSVAHGTWLQAPVPEELYNMIWRWSNAPVLAICFLLLILIALMRSRIRESEVRFALIWAFVPLIGMFALSFGAPMFLDRYLVYAAPGFVLLVALSAEAWPGSPRLNKLVAGLAVAGTLVTFNPWKKNARQPSRVVRVVDEWCNDDCTVEIVPPWYFLNYLAGEELDQLKDDHGDLLVSGVFVPDREMAEIMAPTILVDASGDRSYRGIVDAFRSAYPAVDSVEADHRVWVYRFRR